MTAIRDLIIGVRPVVILENSSVAVARNAWSSLENELRETMKVAARAGVDSLVQLEPKMSDGQDTLELTLQEDARGQEGDVRDIIIVRDSINWEIGISVKHNHTAVKHSRLSATINFGRDWFGLDNTETYISDVRPIFTRLTELKGRGALWSSIPDKEESIYIPLLRAFMDEVIRLNEANPGVVPGSLLKYLIGRKDFYKLIADSSRRTTVLQSFNLNRTLNTASESWQPVLKVGNVELPTRILHFDFRESQTGLSSTTVELTLNNGWTVRFRIHNASSKVEPSLKFDIKLHGVPSDMFSNSVSW